MLGADLHVLVGADLAAEAGPLPHVVHDVDGADDCRRVDRTGDCGVVDVGGDLRVVGPGSVRVAVDDPTSRVDNAMPLGVVAVRAQGLASSGSSCREFRVGERWFGYVLDARTG